MAGWNVKKAGFVTTLLPLGMIIGTLSGGYMSDKIFKGKRTQVIFFSLVFCAVLTVLIPYATIGKDVNALSKQITVSNTHDDSATQTHDEKVSIVLSPAKKTFLIITLVLAGYCLYASIGPYFALCPDLLGVQIAGTGIGIMDAAAYAGAAIGTTTIGILVDHYGYYAVFWFMGGCALPAAIIIKFIREKYED